MSANENTNDATERATRERKTVAELLDTSHFNYEYTAPVAVRFWLEQYVEEGDRALEGYCLSVESGAMDQARLIYDVLYSKYLDTSEYTFPEAARDYIEEYLYKLAAAADVQVWNFPEAAIASLVTLLNCANCSTDDQTDLVALTTAVEALSTRRERRHFLKGDEKGDESKDDLDWRAAYKLSRNLASPKTDEQTRRKLGAALVELAALTATHVDHPAIVARAAEVMFEAVEDASADTPAARTYRLIHELLGGLPETPEVDGDK